ncbi:hypothetical protein CLCR_02628 [Cladophialophora carrionii]|uniref:Uncharacterized protein n=1 Tax=Cladophialophora carrionii TaxID=86049 RepID=A0A1C1CES2_9EURO|nr:hypothetical protein CLCR_02628 [Cladophialophora carrionii]
MEYKRPSAAGLDGHLDKEPAEALASVSKRGVLGCWVAIITTVGAEVLVHPVEKLETTSPAASKKRETYPDLSLLTLTIQGRLAITHSGDTRNKALPRLLLLGFGEQEAGVVSSGRNVPQSIHHFCWIAHGQADGFWVMNAGKANVLLSLFLMDECHSPGAAAPCSKEILQDYVLKCHVIH